MAGYCYNVAVRINGVSVTVGCHATTGLTYDEDQTISVSATVTGRQQNEAGAWSFWFSVQSAMCYVLVDGEVKGSAPTGRWLDEFGVYHGTAGVVDFSPITIPPGDHLLTVNIPSISCTAGAELCANPTQGNACFGTC